MGRVITNVRISNKIINFRFTYIIKVDYFKKLRTTRFFHKKKKLITFRDRCLYLKRKEDFLMSHPLPRI